MSKKGFTIIEIMIVTAIIAILAMAAVAMYSRYIERAHNSVAQSLLQQLAVAEAATAIEAESGNIDISGFVFFADKTDTPEVKKLTDLGFRPDPNIGFAVIPLRSGASGFVAFAAHRSVNSLVYVYDDVSFTGVRPFQAGVIFGADMPDELPIFIMTDDPLDPITATETVKLNITTGLVTSSGP